jgi:hypothetical protein
MEIPQTLMKLDVECVLMNILNKVGGVIKCLGPVMPLLNMLIH